MQTALPYSSLNLSQQTRLARWQRVVTVISMLAMFFQGTDWYGYAAVLPFITRDLALTPGQAGIGMGVFGLAAAATMLFWGFLTDRLLPRRVLFIGLLGMGVTMVAGGLVQNFWQILLVRGLRGAFDAAVFVSGLKLLAEWFPVQRRGFQISLYLTTYSLAIMFDFGVGLQVAQVAGWRTFLLGLGVGSLALALAIPLLVRNRPVDVGLPSIDWGDHPSGTLAFMDVIRTIFRRRWVFLAAAGIFGDLFAISAAATWLVPALLKAQGISIDQASFIGMLMGIGQVIALLVGGKVTDSWQRRLAPMRIGALLAATSGVVFAILTLVAVPVPLLLLAALFSGAGLFSGGAVFALLSDQYGRTLVGTAGGFAQVIGTVGSLVAPALLGVIIESSGSFTLAFAAFVAVELLVLGVLVSTGDPRTATMAEQPLATRAVTG